MSLRDPVPDGDGVIRLDTHVRARSVEVLRAGTPLELHGYGFRADTPDGLPWFESVSVNASFGERSSVWMDLGVPYEASLTVSEPHGLLPWRAIVDDDGAGPLVMELGPHRAEVRVVDEAGRPYVGVELRLSLSGHWDSAFGLTDDDGRAIWYVPDGLYEVAIRDREFEASSARGGPWRVESDRQLEWVVPR